MALPAGDDRADAAAGDARVRLPAEVHHHRHCLRRRQVGSTSPMASLELKNVIKRYGETTVVHGVDLDVGDGEFVVFVGPSGCGKSTLLRMISGLETVSEGDLSIDGRRVNDVSAAQRGLAMVFQSYALYPHMTVYQNMAFGLENIRTPRSEIDAKVQAAAKLLRLDKLLD